MVKSLSLIPARCSFLPCFALAASTTRGVVRSMPSCKERSNADWRNLLGSLAKGHGHGVRWTPLPTERRRFDTPMTAVNGCHSSLYLLRIYRQTRPSSKRSHLLLTLVASLHFHKIVLRIIRISRYLMWALNNHLTLTRCYHCHHHALAEPCAAAFNPITEPVEIRTSEPA